MAAITSKYLITSTIGGHIQAGLNILEVLFMKSGFQLPHMRLRKSEVSFSITRAVRRQAAVLNNEPQNNEPQNFEGWNRCALSLKSIKTDRIPSFDIRYSLFYTRTRPCKTKAFFSIKLAAFQASGRAYPPAAENLQFLTPCC